MSLTWNLYDEILQGSHLDSYVSTNILTFQILVRNKKKCNPEDQIFPFAREYSWRIALRNCSSWKFDRRRELGMYDIWGKLGIVSIESKSNLLTTQKYDQTAIFNPNFMLLELFLLWKLYLYIFRLIFAHVL